MREELYFFSVLTFGGSGLLARVWAVKARRLTLGLRTVLELGLDLRGSDGVQGGSTSGALPSLNSSPPSPRVC